MKILAIDLGKQSFHLHGIDVHGVVISRKPSRAHQTESILRREASIDCRRSHAAEHPQKKTKPRAWAPNTISCVSRG